MANLVLSLDAISAATRMPHNDMLQLLKLCCTSITDDEYAPRKGHTEYKIALVANYKALLTSTAEENDTMTLTIPQRVSGSGWPFMSNTLVVSTQAIYYCHLFGTYISD